MKTEICNLIVAIINNILNNPKKIEEIVRSSNYDPYYLSCKLRVTLYSNNNIIEEANNFGINKYEYVSYFCNKIEKIKKLC